MSMFDYTTQELSTIDGMLEPKLAWAENRTAEAEQLALDATRIISCTEDRLEDYINQGFFKRCWGKLCGKQGEIQRANQKDLIEMQKFGWRYINLLQERDLLLAHSIITIKNNLVTLAVEQEDIRNEITRMAEKVYHRLVDLEKRVESLEVETKIHSWLLTVDTYDYEEKYPPYFRLLRVVNDFFALKNDFWTMKEIRYLQKALKEVELPWKQKLSISDFIDGLLHEIESLSFESYRELLQIDSENAITDHFIFENIPVPSFLSLYQISNNYSKSSTTIEILIEELSLNKTDAMKKVIKAFVQKQGIDIDISVPLRDLAVELLDCMRLTKNLFENQQGNVPTEDEMHSTVKNLPTDTETQNLNVEQEYLEILKDCYEDGNITDDERRILNNLKNKYGISEERAKELEESIKMELDLQDSESVGESENLQDSEPVCESEKNFEWYLSAAQMGDVEAQIKIAEMYFDGDEVQKDEKKAFYWYLKAAESGDAEAQFCVSRFYYYGKETEEDDEKAFEWCIKAANQGFVEAEFGVGELYFNGQGVEENDRLAHQWFLKAAGNGNADAQYKIGVMYENGIYVSQNYTEAYSWYKKAADQDNAEAQNSLGLLVLNGHYSNGNEKMAFDWFKKSAKNENPWGQYHLAHCWENGIGVSEKYQIEAINWYKKASENGLWAAMIQLALYYFMDESNIQKALECLENALDKECLEAIALYSFMCNGMCIESKDGSIGDLFIEGINMNYEKLENAREAYAGDLADDALVLWDSTFWGSGKEGFVISKNLMFTSHQDKILKSLSVGNVTENWYFISYPLKDEQKKAIWKLVQICKKFGIE